MKNILFLMISLILFACAGENQADKIESINPLIIETKQVREIDVTNNDVSLALALQFPDSEHVYFTNADLEDSIVIYSLHTENYELKTVFKIENPSYFEAFYVDEKDSLIYIFLDEELAIYTFQNNLVKSMEIDETENGYLTNLKPLSFFPYVENNKVYMEFFQDIEGSYADPLFYKLPFQAIFDLNSKEISYSEMFYPQEYKDRCYGYNFIPERFINGDKMQIASFPYNDSAYIYNTSGNLIDVKYFGTMAEHSFQYIPFEGIESLQREVFDDFNTNTPFYGLSQYVPFLDYYVRNYFHFDADANTLNISIVFYDKNWSYIGEAMSENGINFFGSKSNGLISLKIKDNKLTIYEISL